MIQNVTLLGTFAFFVFLTVVADANPYTCANDASLVEVPAGAFWMGSDRAERDYGYTIGSEAARKGRWYDNWELLRQRRKLPRYFIDKNLVTQEAYHRFVRETGHRAPFISAADYQRQGYLAHAYTEVKPYLWRKNPETGQATPPDGRKTHPVVLVSRGDAAAYCAWRGRGTPRSYRLPTEAEWEKAARGTNARYFPWGNRFDPTRLNSGYRYRGTTPVGMFPRGASPYGVLDMAGNVFEWTSSNFADGQATMKGGGSWDDAPGITRAAARHGRNPTARHILFGFRCVCEDR